MDRREFIIAGAALLVGCGESPAPSRPPVDTLSDASRLGEADPGSVALREQTLGINSHLLLEDDLRLIRDLGFTHVRSTLYTPRWIADLAYAASARENAARTAANGLGLIYVVHNARDEVFRMGNDPRAARRFAATIAK